MHLSLRSQMITGVAALGATAVAIAPVSHTIAAPSIARVSSAVQLSGLANPIMEIVSVLDYAGFDAFSSISVPPTGPTADAPDPADWLYWPDGFYGSGYVYAPGYWGAIPDFTKQFSFGGLAAVVSNLSNYAWAGLAIPLSVVSGLGGAAFNTPGAIVTAVGYLAAGDTASAIATLQTQILGPIQAGIAGVSGAIGYIVDNVIGNAQTVFTDTLPLLVANLSTAVVGGASAIVNSLVTAATQVITDLAGLQFENAWNDAVTGLLGPNGTLGVIENLTVGIGLIEDVTYDNGDTVPTVTVPSIRSVISSTGQRLGSYRLDGDGGIQNDPFVSDVPVPTAALPAKRVAAAAAKSAAVSARPAAAAAAAKASAKHGRVPGAASRPTA